MVARKRPIGYFIAWLRAGLTVEAGPAGRVAHQALRRSRAIDGPLTFIKRLEARGDALADADLDRLFEWERAQRGSDYAEAEEPADIGDGDS